MHGRLKVRTAEEDKALKHKQQQQKLVAYRKGMQQILSTRKEESYDPVSLNICSQLLSVNPDIYTLWNYRKEVILIEIEHSKVNVLDGEDKLIQFLENEFKLTEQCLLANPKSYGAWHHRYWVLLHHPQPNWANEFNLCTMYLRRDDRNFHVWDFRRLLVNKIGITLSDELQFSTERLNANFSNYSSWHYRSTLRNLDEENVEPELNLINSAIFTDPADTSAWFYLRWVLTNTTVTKVTRQTLMKTMEELEELEPDCKWVIMAKCWLTGNLVLSNKDNIDRCAQYYEDLAKLDPMRRGQYEDYLKAAKVRTKEAGDIKS